jgi:hypothetical protein
MASILDVIYPAIWAIIVSVSHCHLIRHNITMFSVLITVVSPFGGLLSDMTTNHGIAHRHIAEGWDTDSVSRKHILALPLEHVSFKW